MKHTAIIKLTALSLAFTLVTACSGTEAGRTPHNFGSSVTQNITAQVVNPDAAQHYQRAPVHNGERTAIAQRRYEIDDVEKPIEASTSDVMSGAGS